MKVRARSAGGWCSVAVGFALAFGGCAAEGGYVPPDGERPDAEPVVETDDGIGADEPEERDAGLDARATPDVAPRDAALDVARADVVAVDRAAPDVARLDAGPLDARLDASPMDAAPDVVARDVAPPPDVITGTCREQLTALGVRYTVAGATRGIDDPINLELPLNNVQFRYASFTATPSARMLMDCRLALALLPLTRELRDRFQVTDVVHLGIYNYRCIAGTDPCQLSQHARALAIDLNAFRTRAGQTYTVTTDFVMNGRPTCPPRATTMADQVLKDIACWMFDTETFAIILTPNYNAAHRDHFHVDLTEDSHFIAGPRPRGVDPEVLPGLEDILVDDY